MVSALHRGLHGGHGGPAAGHAVTEAQARDLLRRHDGWGGIEAWIAGRRWKTVPDGWTVTGELQS